MSDFFIITHALGAVQGLFLATVLASSRRGSLPNRILAALMVAFSVDLGMAVYHAGGFDQAFPAFIGLDFPLAFLYGPLLYLYVRTLSDRQRHFQRIQWGHFVPFVLVVLLTVPFYLQSGTEKLAYVYADGSATWSTALGWINHLKLVHGLVYIGGILWLLRRHRSRVRDALSTMERVNLRWLRNLLLGIIAMMGFAIVLYVLSLGDGSPLIGLNPDTSYDDYMLLALALFVYAIGYFGLRQPEVFDARLHEPEAPSVAREAPTAPARYARSGMDADTAARHETRLRAAMEAERIYRRGDLTLQDLSDATGISPHHVTEVLNTRLGQHFYDFVNGYRVREVQERLIDPANTHLTLLAIGMEAGFNSKSSFNHTFKKFVGMTPSEFRARAASERTPTAS